MDLLIVPGSSGAATPATHTYEYTKVRKTHSELSQTQIQDEQEMQLTQLSTRSGSTKS